MLIALGLDFTHADVSTRESFHLGDAEVEQAYLRQDAGDELLEFFVLNTCNRVELYGWFDPSNPLDDPHRALAYRYFGRDAEAARFAAAAVPREGEEAARHILRVASGLESQILGDIHILGQLRRAYRDASRYGTVGPQLHRLLDTALRAGKSVKRETDLMAGRSSVGSEAVGFLERRLGGLKDKTCVVLGCGKIGSHAVQNFAKEGVGDLIICNRTRRKAEELARTYGGRAGAWEDRYEIIGGADGVLVATGARSHVLDRAGLEAVAGPRANGRDLLVLDVSMPRNVEPDARGIPGLNLVDIDMLHPKAADVARSRRASVPLALTLLEDQLAEFTSWQAAAKAREALQPLQEALSEICQREISHVAGPGKTADRTASRIVSKLMAGPMIALREEGRTQDLETVERAVRLLFGSEATTPHAVTEGASVG